MEAAFFLPCHALKTHPVVHEITHKFCRRPDFTADDVVISGTAPGTKTVTVTPVPAWPLGGDIGIGGVAAGSYTGAALVTPGGGPAGSITAGDSLNGILPTLPGSVAAYELTVSGITGPGTVIVSIPNGAVHDAAGNASTTIPSSKNQAVVLPSLGAVSSLDLLRQNPAGGDLWDSFQTSTAGAAHVEAIRAGASGNVRLTRSDAALRPVGRSASGDKNGPRVATTAPAGIGSDVRLSGTATDVTLHVTNTADNALEPAVVDALFAGVAPWMT